MIRSLMGIALLVLFIQRTWAEAGGSPRTFVLDLHNLEVAKAAWRAGNPVVAADLALVKTVADRMLTAGPFSVTFTPEIAPSGDPHDLVSYGYYSWPNPNTADGLPWIYRDGFGNPNNEVDWKQIYGLAQAARPLSLAYYFTEDERYAIKLAELMRIFFLDDATRMNPRIAYSDLVPGVSNGSYGVPGFGNALSSSYLLFDAAGILEASPHWTAENRAGLQKWASEFNRWAEFDPKGIIQYDEPSNHGTNYDFVGTLLSLYAENTRNADAHYLNYVLKRMPMQIAADGSNPLEMQRANNLLYHRYNLGRVIDIGALGTKLNTIDLFKYEMEDGRSVRDSIDYLLPYLTHELNWDKWPGAPFDRELPQVYYELLRRAASYYKDPKLLDAANKLGAMSVAYIDLTHPESIVYENYLKGDANLDGQFSTADLIQVFQKGRYDQYWVVTWDEGDWNSDRKFNSADLILAMQQGMFEKGKTTAAVDAVPEPNTVFLLLIGLLMAVPVARFNSNRISAKRLSSTDAAA